MYINMEILRNHELKIIIIIIIPLNLIMNTEASLAYDNSSWFFNLFLFELAHTMYMIGVIQVLNFRELLRSRHGKLLT